MKFDAFVKDYLRRKERKREKFKEIINGKTAEMMYEDYRKQNASITNVPSLHKGEDIKTYKITRDELKRRAGGIRPPHHIFYF